jgi:hypothetical protein
MPELKEKVQTSLDEARILVLGAEVLIGFQYQSVFQKSFEKLPELSQNLKVGGLGLLLVSLALLMWPAAYHRIVLEGHDTTHFHNFVSRAVAPALLPFALGLGIDLYVAGEKIGGRALGLVIGIATAVVALIFLYGIEAVYRAKRAAEQGPDRAKSEGAMSQQGGGDKPTELQDRIKQVLTETRVVLPGAQALLGFQFAAILTESFEKLPPTMRILHLVCLGLIALSTILLMTPAAYHRIVENGNDSESFHTFVSRVLLAAMVPLALGLSGDFYVVVAKVTRQTDIALGSALGILAVFLGLWFGFTLWKRAQKPSGALDAPAAVPAHERAA